MDDIEPTPHPCEDPRLPFTASPHTDTCLVAEKTSFYVKKSILCQNSSYFKAMFSRQWLESSQSEKGNPIFLSDISAELCRTILHFLYTHKLYIPSISDDHVWFTHINDIMEKAHYFGIHEDMELALGILLKKRLTPSSVFQIWNQSQALLSEVLSGECEKYLVHNFNVACETNEFLLCKRELLRRVLRGGEIDVDTDLILEKLKIWGRYCLWKKGTKGNMDGTLVLSGESDVKRYIMDLLPPQTLFSRTFKYFLLKST